MDKSGDMPSLSYAACRRLGRESGSNFRGSFLLLPAAQQRAMDALYAFFRHTDDLADGPQDAQQKAQALTQWRTAMEQCLQSGQLPIDGNCIASGAFASSADVGRAILPALAHTVQLFHIPCQHLTAVIDGVEMDLVKRRYETFADLSVYCDRVASAVGLACIHVWGFHGHDAPELARKSGIALQLTNILRDLGEDLRQDRVYIPLADLKQCDYSIEELKRHLVDERFQRLMRMQIDRAEQFYREGAALIKLLEPSGQRVYGMMTNIYHALLRRIAKRPADVFVRRAQLGWHEKLAIAARWALLPPR
jgi:15-cis-phytoene synthase